MQGGGLYDRAVLSRVEWGVLDVLHCPTNNEPNNVSQYVSQWIALALSKRKSERFPVDISKPEPDDDPNREPNEGSHHRVRNEL